MTQFTKKEVFILEIALKELHSLPTKTQQEFAILINEISECGYLTYPEGKKMRSYDLFEMRIRDDDSYRCLYCYLGEIIAILSFFKKKSNKTPIKQIRKAINRKNHLSF